MAVVGGLSFGFIAAGSASPTLIVNAETCGISTAGSVYCWGGSVQSDTAQTHPRLIETPTPLVALFIGGFGRLGLDAGGTVWQFWWAAATEHEQVADFRFEAIAVGKEHACGLDAAGSVYCWGNNGLGGQLGNGTVTGVFRPTQVVSSAAFVQISASSYHTCGVRTDMSLTCWGMDDERQLGLGRRGSQECTAAGFTDRCEPSPALVTGATQRWRSVTAGGNHTCAISDVGFLYCWGRNRSFQAGGEDDTRPVEVPTRVFAPS